MAEVIVKKYIDDFDGGHIEEGDLKHLKIIIGDMRYELDLSSKNADAFLEANSKFLQNAQKDSTVKSSAGEIRRWARENGHEVSEKGRIPKGVLKAHKKALES